MDVDKYGKPLSNGEKGDGLSDEQVKRSVIISNIPRGAKRDDLYIHFQKTANGGGEIEDLKMLNDGKAVLIYEEAKVAESVLEKEQKFGDLVLQLQPYIKEEIVSDKKDVFSLVSAKINPKVFNMSSEEIEQVLSKIARETKINYIELSDGFWVSGTYKQINVTCLKLSACVTHEGARINDVSSNSHDVRQLDREPVVLDVQPKLMHILSNHIKKLKQRHKMKIEQKEDKVMLSPLDNDWQSFETGKEEFITLYQKAFQEMDEKSFELKEDATNIKQLGKEIMNELNVVIEFRNKTVCIYGKNEHVVQAMQRLQGKPRRSRRACKPASDELPKPDTFAPLPQVLSHQLENGVTVTVSQGDITQQEADVIVNAANERLEHGGGVAGAIVKHGGYQIQEESRKLIRQFGIVPVGQVAQTNSGRLPCKKIFHAVGPQWSVHGPQGSRQLILNACIQCFHLGSKFGFKSIVLPAISSGIFGVPKEICAEVLFLAAEMFSCEATSQNQLRDIRFVNIDSPTNDAFRQEFHKRYVKKQAIDNGELTANVTTPASLSYPPGDSGKPFSTRDEEKKENRASSKGASRGNNKPNPGSCAAHAAMKRAEQFKDVENETLPQNEFKDSASGSSFESGFQTRQTTTHREDKNDIDKRERGTLVQELKDHVKKKSSLDGKVGTESKFPDGHKSSVTNIASQGGRPSKNREKSTSEIKTGRGRGAIAPKFNSPGHAKRVLPSREQTGVSATEKGKSSTNLDDSTEKALLNLSLHQNTNNGQDSPTEKAQRPSFLQEEDEGHHQHGKNEKHLSDNQTESLNPGTCPPGLDITPEGLNLAAESFAGNDSSASLSQPADCQDKNMNEHCMKRKNPEDPSERSPKLRKEDQQESGGLPDKKEQPKEDDKGLKKSSDDDSIKKEDEKDRKQSGGDNRTKHDDKKEQEQSTGDDNTRKDHKKHQEQLGDAVEKQKDEKDQQQSVSGENTKQGDKKDQEQSSGGNKTQQDHENDQEQSFGDDRTKHRDYKKDQKQSVCDDNSKQEDEKDQKQSSDDDNTMQGDKKEQEQSGGDDNTKQNDEKDQKQRVDNDNTKQGDKKEQEQSGDDDNTMQGDKKEQEQSGGDDNTKQNDEKDQKQSVDDDNTKQGDKKEQEQSGGDDNTKQEDEKDQKQSMDNDDTKQGDKKDQKQSGGDSNIKQDDEQNQEQKHKDECNEGIEKTSAKRDHVELQNNEDSKYGNEISTDQYNDLDQIDDSANCQSMESFVVLNIEDEQQINKTNSVDDKADESSSSESIVLVDAPDECRPNGELQSDNSSHSISTTNAKQSKQEEGIIGDDNKSSSVVEIPKNDSEASVKTCNVEMSDGDTNESTTDSSRGVQKNEKNLGEEQFPPENEKPSEKIVSKIESDDVDNLANMMQGLSTSDNNSATKETPVDKNTPVLPEAGECGLCTTTITNDNPKVILSGCGHVICEQCTEKFNEQKSSICPICEKKAGCNALQPPNGQIKHGIMDSSPLPGFDGSKTIYIDYLFDGGIQGSCHHNPGLPYDSLERRTFLPDTEEGQEVLELLQEAFEAGLLFTVGRCTINSKENQIIFSDVVDHKFNLKGTTTCGYPDPDYLGTAKEKLELALKKKSSPSPPPEDVTVI